MRESGEHKVSLDQVIQTMYETGKDMQTRYKETLLGGLATLNIIECQIFSARKRCSRVFNLGNLDCSLWQ